MKYIRRRSLQVMVAFILAAVGIGVSGCIIEIIQPATAVGGQPIVTRLIIDPEVTGTYRLYLGVELPNGWEVVGQPAYTDGLSGQFVYSPTAVSTLDSEFGTASGSFWGAWMGPPVALAGGVPVSTVLTLRSSVAATGVYSITYVDGVYTDTLTWSFPLSSLITMMAQAVPTGSQVLYLPMVLKEFCPFNYNETILYNLDKINAPDAWGCPLGQNVVVGVVDSGADLDHPDLEANIVAGTSFVSASPDDDRGHGSHVSGILAGVANNGGIIGVAPEAKIMPVKVLNYQGASSSYIVAQGITWAADNGADIINASLGSKYNSSTVYNAVSYAYNRGILIVAAAGNCGDGNYYLNGCDYPDQPVYPAALSQVVAVASTNAADAHVSSSNEGSYVELAAPGYNVYSTLIGSYGYGTGTSMASPHVAGLAALIWSQQPGWSHEQVRAHLRNTAVDLGTAGWDDQFGYGRINAQAAVAALALAPPPAEENLFEQSQVAPTKVEAPFVPGQVLLQLRPGFTLDDVLGQADVQAASVMEMIDAIGVQQLAVSPGQEKAMLARLRAHPGVVYAELNHVMTVQ